MPHAQIIFSLCILSIIQFSINYILYLLQRDPEYFGYALQLLLVQFERLYLHCGVAFKGFYILLLEL